VHTLATVNELEDSERIVIAVLLRAAPDISSLGSIGRAQTSNFLLSAFIPTCLKYGREFGEVGKHSIPGTMAFSLSFESLLRDMDIASAEEAFRCTWCTAALPAIVAVVDSDLNRAFLLHALSLASHGIYGSIVRVYHGIPSALPEFLQR